MRKHYEDYIFDAINYLIVIAGAVMWSIAGYKFHNTPGQGAAIACGIAFGLIGMKIGCHLMFEYEKS